MLFTGATAVGAHFAEDVGLLSKRRGRGDMKLLCWLGFHLWQPAEDWASRLCPRCEHKEILIYTAEGGAVWERVT